MTCKDCLHAEVCGTFAIASETFEISSPERTASSCNDFKDRSRFVELPCRDGDTVYYFNHAGIIFSQRVLGFIVNSVGILVDSDVMFDSNLIGNKFFLTREEAEQALKERENNA